MYSLRKMRKNTTVAGSLLHLENAAEWLCQSKMQKRLNQFLIKLKVSLKSHFFSDYKKFWVVENSKLVTDRLDQINTKLNAKLISTFGFSTLQKNIPHKDLLKVLFDLTDFGFNGRPKKKFDFSLKKMLFDRTSLNSFFH